MIVCAVCRSLDDIKDREICCYSVSCKERENIGKFVLLLLLFNVLLPAHGWVGGTPCVYQYLSLSDHRHFARIVSFSFSLLLM